MLNILEFWIQDKKSRSFSQLNKKDCAQHFVVFSSGAFCVPLRGALLPGKVINQREGRIKLYWFASCIVLLQTKDNTLVEDNYFIVFTSVKRFFSFSAPMI